MAKSKDKVLKNTENEAQQEQVKQLKSRAQVKLHGVDNTSTFEHPASFSGTTGKLDESSLKHFIQNTDIQIKKLTDDEIVFDFIGAEPPLANALRRIMIAEIPTIAIEKVTMWQNTSIIPDENLAHRVGLIPIAADGRDFEFHKKDAEYTPKDSIKFRLHKICSKKDPKVPAELNNNHDEEKLYNNANVYSGDLEYISQDGQQTYKPIHDDILIAKMRPGQEIEMDLICEKGIGKTHAKWSPVCTAYYRLLPDIQVNDITGEDAKELKKLCPMGVFDIEDLGGIITSTVKNPRNCTTCRECIRHDKFADRVNLGKKKDVFEFHVESLGMYKPQDIVLQAFTILKEKANKWIDVVQEQENC